MSKKANLNTIVNSTNSFSAINAELDKLNEQFENTVSRDGSTPNNMDADFDLDDNDLLNVGVINARSILLSGTSLTQSIADSQEDIAVSVSQASASAAAAAASAAAVSLGFICIIYLIFYFNKRF